MKYDDMVRYHGRRLRSLPFIRRRQDYFIRLAYGAARIARQWEHWADHADRAGLMEPAMRALVNELEDAE